MLINYFGSSSILRIFQNKKNKKTKEDLTRKNLLNSMFSDKCKKCFPQNFRSWLTAKNYWMNKIVGFRWLYLYHVCFVSHTLRNVVDLTTWNILKITKAILMSSLGNIPRYQIFIWGAKYFLISADFWLWKD